MADKNNVNIGFEKQIWDVACALWGHIPAAEYRKIIIGLIFLRYISNAFEKRYNELVAEGEGFEEDRDEYISENIFFVPEKARWATIASAAHTPEIGTVIDEAMKAIEKENHSLKGVLPKNYASPDLDKRVLGDVVDLFTNMDMTDTAQGKDLLGRTYEYCIAQFAAYEGKKGGEFYTPSSIVKTIVAILKPFNNCRVYDPCCGSGGMFVQSVKFIEAHSGNRQSVSVYGQESNADTWKMAKMNMAIRGIDANLGEHQADTFFDDLHPCLKADFIMANPPFNLSNWGQDKLKDDVRWKYGTPPDGNANYAWIQHMIHHLSPNGKIGLVLANGALSTQSSGEGDIRKNIINADLVEGIVALPTQLFYSVTIPVTLWFISKNKKQKGKTLFIDARKMGYMVDRKHRDFTDEDIQKLADTFEAFQNGTLEDVKGFCAVADLKDIEKQDYILTPGRYVGIEETEDDGEPFEEKMTRLTSELSELFAKSHKLEEEIRKKLGAIGYEV
ncbi:MAG: class I SAM-dependent DNA methyltransferase [Pyramidobacter sp.]|nr:class I SAM-dependent DNA methyltransferase [Pyramidobacter sp.]